MFGLRTILFESQLFIGPCLDNTDYNNFYFQKAVM